MLGILRILVNNIYKKCEIILCQSKSFAKEISKSIKRTEKILYFPAWSDVDFLKVAKDYAPEIDLKKSYFNIIFAGNIGEAQDFPSIIKAFQIISRKNGDRSTQGGNALILTHSTTPALRANNPIGS